MKTFKEQADEAIYSHKMIECGESAVKIQTLIEVGEYFIDFIENHVYYDDDSCNFDHHGYCQTHNTCSEDRCSNTIITKQKREIEESITKLKGVLNDI